MVVECIRLHIISLSFPVFVWYNTIINTWCIQNDDFRKYILINPLVENKQFQMLAMKKNEKYALYACSKSKTKTEIQSFPDLLK